jgi:ATP-dependent RNA helicase DeaD
MNTPEIPAVPNATFSDFAISPEVAQAMAELGYTTPTPIQARALPALLGDSQDFIGLASTGTGKTAAFGIPLVESVDTSSKDTQALVLSPTRELAMQVSEQLGKLGKYKGVRVATIYGGASYTTQLSAIQRGAHIIVATPGRLVDFLEQKKIALQKVKAVVLDEADEMISMGFKEDLEFILSATHSVAAEGEPASKKQARASCKTWLFSATMSRDIRRVADLYLKDPVTVQINAVGGLSDKIEQIYYTVRDGAKTELIGRLLQIHPQFYGIIFCQTKLETVQLCDYLNRSGFSTDALHGDRSQKEREITLKKFRNKEIQCIVATDVAARGLDIKDLTHVINHSLPWDTESYIHRIGRTGRNGQTGIALTLVNPNQIHSLKRVQAQTKTVMKKGVIPRRSDVAKTKVEQVLQSLMAVKDDGRQYKLALRLVQELALTEAVKDVPQTMASIEDSVARMLVVYQSAVLVDDEKELDFMGSDRAPRELSEENSDRGGYEPRGRGSFRPRSGGGGFGRRSFGGGGGGNDRRDNYRSRDRGGERVERTENFERSETPAEREFKPRTEYAPRSRPEFREKREGFAPRGEGYIPREKSFSRDTARPAAGAMGKPFPRKSLASSPLSREIREEKPRKDKYKSAKTRSSSVSE